MPIRVKCDSCGAQYALKDELAGKRIRCPGCKMPLTVPGEKTAATEGYRAPLASESTRRHSVKPQPPAPSVRKAPERKSTLADPEATVFMTAPISTRTQVGVPRNAATCPSCGKALDAKSTNCPACGFNIRLGRKLSLTSAIADASREPGVRADGTRYATRGELAEKRAQTGSKIRIGIYSALALTLVLAAIISAVIMQGGALGPPLEELRQSILTPPRYQGQNPLDRTEWVHPYCCGLEFSLNIPVKQIRIETPPTPPAGEPVTSWAAFAEKCRLPRFHKRPVFASSSTRIIDASKSVNGLFSPAALEKGAELPGEQIAVWRASGKETENGFLVGLLLDFGENQEAQLEKLAELSKGDVTVKGRLYFVSCLITAVKDAGYALALSEELDRVPAIPANTKIECREQYVFLPVLQVSSFGEEVEPVTDEEQSE